MELLKLCKWNSNNILSDLLTMKITWNIGIIIRNLRIFWKIERCQLSDLKSLVESAFFSFLEVTGFKSQKELFSSKKLKKIDGKKNL